MSTKSSLLVVSYILVLIAIIGWLVFDMKSLYDDLHSYEKQVEVLELKVRDLEVDKRKLLEKVNFYVTEHDQMTISYELGGYVK